ncbi:hypothetical protein BDN67DRAFT_913096 [Paxillus ammoniavirescens]|nr:hypothetical protein BDN67DRAFT_913096 [Paxillus ammoniavirescens]
MTLPKNHPTLEALATKNWTHPDNVVCTEHTVQYMEQCYTDPACRGPKTDHVSIISVIKLETPRSEAKKTRNYRDVNWKKFQSMLKAKLSTQNTSIPITSNDEFQQTAKTLTDTILETIETHISTSHPCPHSKRWWSRELSDMKKDVARVASQLYKTHALPNHPSHENHHTLRNVSIQPQ